MAAAEWIALGGAAATFLANLAGYLVAWGVMQATLKSLGGRVESLEREVSGLSALKVDLARIGERQDLWIEQLKDLNAAIRWMREPAGAEGPRGGRR